MEAIRKTTTCSWNASAIKARFEKNKDVPSPIGRSSLLATRFRKQGHWQNLSFLPDINDTYIANL
jgi:hypothetical protein